MPRFVILRHELPSGHARSLHWDLLLESGTVLRAWALASEPLTSSETMAEQLPDHRLMYLDYEGPISGDRGTVTRWDAGDYQLQVEGPDQVVVQLCGGRLRGMLSLARSTERHFWRVSFSAAPTTG